MSRQGLIVATVVLAIACVWLAVRGRPQTAPADVPEDGMVQLYGRYCVEQSRLEEAEGLKAEEGPKREDRAEFEARMDARIAACRERLAEIQAESHERYGIAAHRLWLKIPVTR